MSDLIPQVLIDPKDFDIKNASITEIGLSNGRSVANLRYTDPKTGVCGNPQVLLKGRWEVVFEIKLYDGKYYITLNSQVNSIDPSKSNPDEDHRLAYKVFKEFDDLCTQYAHKNPEAWLGDLTPSEQD